MEKGLAAFTPGVFLYHCAKLAALATLPAPPEPMYTGLPCASSEPKTMPVLSPVTGASKSGWRLSPRAPPSWYAKSRIVPVRVNVAAEAAIEQNEPARTAISTVGRKRVNMQTLLEVERPPSRIICGEKSRSSFLT